MVLFHNGMCTDPLGSKSAENRSRPLPLVAALSNCRTGQTKTGGRLNVRIFEQPEPRPEGADWISLAESGRTLWGVHLSEFGRSTVQCKAPFARRAE